MWGMGIRYIWNNPARGMGTLLWLYMGDRVLGVVHPCADISTHQNIGSSCSISADAVDRCPMPALNITQRGIWCAIWNIFVLHLGVDKWAVFGGSWGATLSLIYAQSHPDCVSHLILRGVFLMTQPELDWFYGGGAGKFWPELWQRFVSVIPEEERDDLITAYHKRLFSGDMREEMRFGTTWTNWENAMASFQSNGFGGHCPPAYARTFARIENHYFINGGFLNQDQKILNNMERIRHIQGYIVQGRYDMICPPAMAYELSRKWPRCDLRIMSYAGHAMSEPKISSELVSVMDKLRF
jgi:proline iminopeptidase